MKNQEKAGVLLSYTNTILNTLVGFLYTPFMLRTLGTSEFGLYVLIGSIVGYISLFDFGLHSTITRFVAKYIAQKDRKSEENFLALCVGIYSILTVIVVGIGITLHANLDRIFGHNLTVSELVQAKTMFWILIFNIGFSLPFDIFRSIALGYGKFVLVNGSKTIRIITRTIALISVLILGYGAIGIVIVDTVINVLVALVYMFYVFSKLGVRIKFHCISKEAIQEISTYSVFIFILAMVNQFYWRLGQIILGLTAGTTEVAIYGVVVQIITYVTTINLTLSSVLLPRVTRLTVIEKDMHSISNLMIRVGRIQFMFISLFIIGFSTLGRDFILLWAGSKYELAYYCILLLLIGISVQTIQTTGTSALKALNLHKHQANIYLISAVINIVLAFFLSKFWGVVGVSVSTMFCILFIQGFWMNRIFRKKANIDTIRFFKETFYRMPIPLLLSFAIAFIVSSFNTSGWIFFLLKVIIVVISFMGIMWMLALNSSEKALLLGLFHKIIKDKEIKV